MARHSEQHMRTPAGGAIQERRASTRFSLNLELRYTVSYRCTPVETGTGRTIDLSSSGLAFTADTPLPMGVRIDVSIDWPVLLDGGVKMQLKMSGLVVRTNGTETALQIHRHEFKTRRAGPSALTGRESVRSVLESRRRRLQAEPRVDDAR
jgi:hypothetical protein